MRKISFLLILLFPLISSSSDDDLKNIMDNISSEYTVCASFYSILSAAMLESGQSDGAEKLKETSLSALNYAMNTLEQHKTPEISEKVTSSRFSLHIKDMMNSIENDISNISILMATYGDSCKKAIEQPLAFMESFIPAESK